MPLPPYRSARSVAAQKTKTAMNRNAYRSAKAGRIYNKAPVPSFKQKTQTTAPGRGGGGGYSTPFAPQAPDATFGQRWLNYASSYLQKVFAQPSTPPYQYMATSQMLGMDPSKTKLADIIRGNLPNPDLHANQRSVSRQFANQRRRQTFGARQAYPVPGYAMLPEQPVEQEPWGYGGGGGWGYGGGGGGGYDYTAPYTPGDKIRTAVDVGGTPSQSQVGQQLFRDTSRWYQKLTRWQGW